MKKMNQSFEQANTMPALISLQYVYNYYEEMEFYIDMLVSNIPVGDIHIGGKGNTVTPNLPSPEEYIRSLNK